MRGLIPGAVSRHPLEQGLPGLLQQDSFALRFTAAFDECLAPVFYALDNLHAYLDPGLAPEDFVDWLSGWVGLALDENVPLERRRGLVARAVDLYRWRGTIRGIAEQVETLTGTAPEVVDNGGVAWSTTPHADLPGRPEPSLTVRLRVPRPDDVDVRSVEAVVEAARPAHVPATVEVLKK